MRTNRPIAIDGLRDVLPDFDAYLIDQFGVLHDGTAPYPGAVDALLRLKRAGKYVVLLSNSGRRSKQNVTRLCRLGFAAGSWDQFLSSGELAWSILAEQLSHGSKETKCFLIVRDGDRSPIEGLPVRLTTAADCEIVVIAGSEGDVVTIEQYAHMLEPAASRCVPAYCTNPDMQMLTSGGLHFGAGRIAKLYEELGGEVLWIGKPYPEIYRAAIRITGNLGLSRILCVGDSIEHDIAGAQGAGLRSWMITGGIHDGMGTEQLRALFAEHGVAADYLSHRFNW